MRGGKRKHHNIKAQRSKLPARVAASSKTSTKQPPKPEFPCRGEKRHFSWLSPSQLGLGRKDKHARWWWWLCLKHGAGHGEPQGLHLGAKPPAHSMATSMRMFWGRAIALSCLCSPCTSNGAEFSAERFYGHFKSLCFRVLHYGKTKQGG